MEDTTQLIYKLSDLVEDINRRLSRHEAHIVELSRRSAALSDCQAALHGKEECFKIIVKAAVKEHKYDDQQLHGDVFITFWRAIKDSSLRLQQVLHTIEELKQRNPVRPYWASEGKTAASSSSTSSRVAADLA